MSDVHGEERQSRSVTVGSLFSGIGGLDLGLERAGMTVAWQSEIDPYASRVLARHWPDVPNLGDITNIEWSDEHRVDLICGGYPCPAFSQAARGRNVAENLWPWMRDAISALRDRRMDRTPGHARRAWAGGSVTAFTSGQFGSYQAGPS